MRNCIVLLVTLAGTLTAQSPPSVIGNGWGLDHVIVGLPGPEAVKEVFGAKLGFTPFTGIKFPSQGLERAVIPLPPQASVELLWPYQETQPGARPLVALVRKKVAMGGGPVAYNLNVSPAEGAADAMRRLGLRVNLPLSQTFVTPDGKETRGPWQYVDIDPADQAAQPLGVPGGAGVGFVEYQSQSDRLKPERFQRALEIAQRDFPDPRRSAGEIHANTARKLRSVWVAVPSVTEAVREAARFGFVVGAESQFKALGENGQEVQCGQGSIVFFEPAHQNSPLAALVKKQGLGPFGVSIGVADLKTAQRVVQEGTQAKFQIQHSGNRTSFIVPAELAAGTVIEFVQM